jgi:hypothetical protein
MKFFMVLLVFLLSLLSPLQAQQAIELELVGTAIPTGLLVDKLSSDPHIRAEGLVMARRAAYW